MVVVVVLVDIVVVVAHAIVVVSLVVVLVVLFLTAFWVFASAIVVGIRRESVREADVHLFGRSQRIPRHSIEGVITDQPQKPTSKIKSLPQPQAGIQYV